MSVSVRASEPGSPDTPIREASVRTALSRTIEASTLSAA
jgi:hypothetical protein